MIIIANSSWPDMAVSTFLHPAWHLIPIPCAKQVWASLFWLPASQKGLKYKRSRIWVGKQQKHTSTECPWSRQGLYRPVKLVCKCLYQLVTDSCRNKSHEVLVQSVVQRKSSQGLLLAQQFDWLRSTHLFCGYWHEMATAVANGWNACGSRWNGKKDLSV